MKSKSTSIFSPGPMLSGENVDVDFQLKINSWKNRAVKQAWTLGFGLPEAKFEYENI